LAGMMLAGAGCAVLRVEADTSKPVLLNNPERLPTRYHFRAEGSHAFFLWGLVGNDNKAVNDAILKELGDSRGIVNLKVTKYSSFLDLLISGVTLGLVSPRSFTLEGDRI
jgi:hypothetical protein